ncbi:MAG: hypothetical protein ACXWXS_09795, partial [Actinomycetota bacterium]
MTDKEHNSPAAILEGSHLVRKGRADVFRARERTRLKKVLRAVAFVLILDFLLYRWYAAGNSIGWPHLGPDFIIFLPVIGLFLVIILMAAMPLMNGRSPHMLIAPEQVEIGLTDLKGLDAQVEEVVRTLDVFLGYATFREELGGTPR